MPTYLGGARRYLDHIGVIVEELGLHAGHRWGPHPAAVAKVPETPG
jgi:hypothetical protein